MAWKKVNTDMNIAVEIACRMCNVKKTRIRTGVIYAGGKHKYVDENGVTWEGATICPECKNLYVLKKRRKNGVKAVDELVDCKTARGREAEVLAEKYFNGLGYTTELNEKPYGCDLLVNGKSIEVKRAFKERKANTWRVSPVSPHRMDDDLIAYVYVECRKVVIQDMKEHLSSCDKTGRRVVSKFLTLGDEYVDVLEKKLLQD